MLRPQTRVLARCGISQLGSRSLARTYATKKPFSTRFAEFSAHAWYRINRGASFAANSAIVILGVGILGVTGYYLSQELIVTGSDTQLFHKAFAEIEKNEEVKKLVGEKLKAHGESVNQRNVKSRPLATRRGFDQFGDEHVMMQFHVDGELDSGIVKFESVLNRQSGQYDYKYLLLDTNNHGRIYLVNDEGPVKRKGGLFGIKWGKKHEN